MNATITAMLLKVLKGFLYTFISGWLAKHGIAIPLGDAGGAAAAPALASVALNAGVLHAIHNGIASLVGKIKKSDPGGSTVAGKK